ncbi:hypothetical protein BDFB_013203, partial [Asbolus verrucosus]
QISILSRGNAREAVRRYQERFSDRRLRETGKLLPDRRERGPPRPDRILNIEEDVLDAVYENPIFLEDLMCHLDNLEDASRTTSLPEPCPKSSSAKTHRFCSSTNILRMVLSTSIMYMCGQMQTPMLTVSSTFRTFRTFQFSINLWAGLVGHNIIEPFELPHRLNGNSYYEFLSRDLPGLLENVPLQLRRDIWFMHDGAPPHFSLR